ncbi:MAG: hypothetical protein ACK4NZ_04995 [Tsuneonella sp.]
MTATLSSLWEISLLMCVCALLAIAGLLLARVMGERRADTRDDLRRQLLPHLLRGEPAPPVRSRLARRVAADLTIELAELVRGNDRETFIAAAALAGADTARRRIV